MKLDYEDLNVILSAHFLNKPGSPFTYDALALDVDIWIVFLEPKLINQDLT